MGDCLVIRELVFRRASMKGNFNATAEPTLNPLNKKTDRFVNGSCELAKVMNKGSSRKTILKRRPDRNGERLRAVFMSHPAATEDDFPQCWPYIRLELLKQYALEQLAAYPPAPVHRFQKMRGARCRLR